MASNAPKAKKATDRTEYMREYYQQRRDDLRKAKHERYLQNRDEHIAYVQSRKPGADEREPREVPIRRRWLVIGDRIYFNSKLGVSDREIVTALGDLRDSIKTQGNDKASIAANRIRQRKHLEYLANQKDAVAKAQTYREEKLGSTPRDETPVGTRITVSKRRWMVVGHRLYFNPKVELTVEDVLQAMTEQQKAISRRK